MEKVYCRYCGKLIDEDAKFCSYCGASFDATKTVDSLSRKERFLSILSSRTTKLRLQNILLLSIVVFIWIVILSIFGVVPPLKIWH